MSALGPLREHYTALLTHSTTSWAKACVTGADEQAKCFESSSKVYLYHFDEYHLYLLCSLC